MSPGPPHGQVEFLSKHNRSDRALCAVHHFDQYSEDEGSHSKIGCEIDRAKGHARCEGSNRLDKTWGDIGLTSQNSAYTRFTQASRRKYNLSIEIHATFP